MLNELITALIALIIFISAWSSMLGHMSTPIFECSKYCCFVLFTIISHPYLSNFDLLLLACFIFGAHQWVTDK